MPIVADNARLVGMGGLGNHLGPLGYNAPDLNDHRAALYRKKKQIPRVLERGTNESALAHDTNCTCAVPGKSSLRSRRSRFFESYDSHVIVKDGALFLGNCGGSATAVGIVEGVSVASGRRDLRNS